MSLGYAFKSLESTEAPVITERHVKAVIGCVDVVDNDNELIVGESFKISKIRGSRWLHNSMPLAKMKGLVNEIEEPIGYGQGSLDGTKIIGDLDVMKGARGDAFLEHVRSAGDALGYSHGFSIESKGARPDGVTLLHGAWTVEMSPVPDPASPGTGTLAALLGMKELSVQGQPFPDFVEEIVQEYLNSEDFVTEVRRAVRWVAFDMAQSQAWDALWDAVDKAEMKSKDTDAFRDLFVKNLIKYEAGKLPTEDPPQQLRAPAIDSMAVLQNLFPHRFDAGA